MKIVSTFLSIWDPFPIHFMLFLAVKMSKFPAESVIQPTSLYKWSWVGASFEGVVIVTSRIVCRLAKRKKSSMIDANGT